MVYKIYYEDLKVMSDEEREKTQIVDRYRYFADLENRYFIRHKKNFDEGYYNSSAFRPEPILHCTWDSASEETLEELEETMTRWATYDRSDRFGHRTSEADIEDVDSLFLRTDHYYGKEEVTWTEWEWHTSYYNIRIRTMKDTDDYQYGYYPPELLEHYSHQDVKKKLFYEDIMEISEARYDLLVKKYETIVKQKQEQCKEILKELSQREEVKEEMAILQQYYRISDGKRFGVEMVCQLVHPEAQSMEELEQALAEKDYEFHHKEGEEWAEQIRAKILRVNKADGSHFYSFLDMNYDLELMPRE